MSLEPCELDFNGMLEYSSPNGRTRATSQRFNRNKVLLWGGSPNPVPPVMTLQKAIDMGEYDPDFLATFPEWLGLSRHIQWEMIRQGLRNRRRQLRVHWAELANQPDFSKKPHLATAMRNIERQISELGIDEEKLQVEYSM